MAEVGDTACAQAVRRSPSLIRKWSDPDNDTLPNLRQALLLDALYVAKTGKPAPILSLYQSRLAETLSPAPAAPSLDMLNQLTEVFYLLGVAAKRINEEKKGRIWSPNERLSVLSVLADLKAEIGLLEAAVNFEASNIT